MKRALAALLLLWFAIVTGVPGARHSCPVHEAQAHAAAGAAAHAAQAHNSAGAGHSHQLPDRDGGHRSCTCIGDCNAAGVVAGVPGGHVVLAIVSVQQTRVELPPAESPAITAPAFLLPYANGPPRGQRVA